MSTEAASASSRASDGDRDTIIPEEALDRVSESAERLGVRVDRESARRWIMAMAARQDNSEIIVDARDGVYGAAATMLDFSPADLDHFRYIGRIVAIPDVPGKVETALALSGSAAQSKFQIYPGDADFFQRVNIKATARAEAVDILSKLMRDKALATLQGPDYELLSVSWGTWPQDSVRNGETFRKGAHLRWMPQDVRAGEIHTETPSGEKIVIDWASGKVNTGWNKLDWVVADAVRGRLVSASNVLDVTWETPEGEITPLDGFLDPYFQEVYLDANSIPLFTKLVKHITTDALDDYVRMLEGEITKYMREHPNFGKVAKRSYNVFRLTGRYPEAVFIRDLFDEPVTALYQASQLFDAIEEADNPDTPIDRAVLLRQLDAIIERVRELMQGEPEERVIAALERARKVIAEHGSEAELESDFSGPRQDLIDQTNQYFRNRLYALPAIAGYLRKLGGEPDTSESG